MPVSALQALRRAMLSSVGPDWRSWGGGGSGGPPPAGGPSYTTPTTLFVDGREFRLVGVKQDWSARVYDDGSYRFELRPGEKESVAFTDPAGVERTQFDGWPTLVSDGHTIEVTYGVRFEQNAPGLASSMLIHEWHNTLSAYVGPVPLRILFDTAGATKPLWASHRHAASDPSVGGVTVTEDLYQLIPDGSIDPSRFYTIKERVRFGAADGIWQVWVDDVLKVNITNGNVGFRNHQHYPEFGIYRASAADISIVWLKPLNYVVIPEPNDAITTAYLAASSDTVSAEEQDSINTLVLDLKAAGIPLNGASSCISLVDTKGSDNYLRDLLHPSVKGTVHGTVTHTPGVGVAGNGSVGSYIDTLSTMTTNDDVVFMVQGAIGASTAPPLGDNDYAYALGNFNGFFQARISGGSDFFGGSDPGNGAGFAAVRRNNSTTIEFFDATGSRGTSTLAEVAPSGTATLRIGQVGGVASPIPVVLCGKLPSLTTAQITALKNACLAFQARQLLLA